MDNNIIKLLSIASLSNLSSCAYCREIWDIFCNYRKIDQNLALKKTLEIVLRDLKKLPSKSYSIASAEYERAMEEGAEVVPIFSDYYPKKFYKLPDPPLVIFARNLLKNIDLINSDKTNIIGFVGSRDCSRYGFEATDQIAKSCSRVGIGIISGLAKGIDTIAHRAALEASAKLNISVIGSGIENIYPKSNQILYSKMISSGAVIISEYGMSLRAQKYFFPRRNRLVAALSDAILVTEAREKSGALITARLASELGKDVFAIPGPINSQMSMGSNWLIKQGALVVTSAKDIFEEFGVEKELQQKAVASVSSKLEGDAQTVFEIVEQEGPVDISSLASKSDLDITKIMEIICSLELEGILENDCGVISRTC